MESTKEKGNLILKPIPSIFIPKSPFKIINTPERLLAKLESYNIEIEKNIYNIVLKKRSQFLDEVYDIPAETMDFAETAKPVDLDDIIQNIKAYPIDVILLKIILILETIKRDKSISDYMHGFDNLLSVDENPRLIFFVSFWKKENPKPNTAKNNYEFIILNLAGNKEKDKLNLYTHPYSEKSGFNPINAGRIFEMSSD